MKAMPLFMVIGPFLINIEQLRTALIEKRREIVKRLLEYFCDRMQKATEILCDKFRRIMLNLQEKATSVERLLELREYVTIIPNLLEGLEDRLRITLIEYDILDYFFYNLSNTHFALKWEAIGWPFRITKQIPNTKENHKIDIEEFKKMHQSELVNFEGQVESINSDITNFSLQFDPNKAVEMSVEAARVWKFINELHKLFDLLQSRQVIFELPELSRELLDGYTQGFRPYKNLWTACADFIKLEELAYGNPMNVLDMEKLWNTAHNIANVLTQSLEDFSEVPEIKAIAEVYLSHIENFKGPLKAIACLKDENWLLPHWHELCKRAGIDIKPSANINFSFCIAKGILNHLELVYEIQSRAAFEADEYRRAQEEEERLRKEEELRLLERRRNRKARTDIM